MLALLLFQVLYHNRFRVEEFTVHMEQLCMRSDVAVVFVPVKLVCAKTWLSGAYVSAIDWGELGLTSHTSGSFQS